MAPLKYLDIAVEISTARRREFALSVSSSRPTTRSASGKVLDKALATGHFYRACVTPFAKISGARRHISDASSAIASARKLRDTSAAAVENDRYRRETQVFNASIAFSIVRRDVQICRRWRRDASKSAAVSGSERLEVGVEIASTTTHLDYRPRMHARHGQGAAAAQARPPRSKLSDLFHLWVNNIRLLYSWRSLDDLSPQLQLPPNAMGNLQSDSKKKQKKKDVTALPASTSTSAAELEVTTTVDEPKKDDQPPKRDQAPRVPDGREEYRETPKISVEKTQTPGHVKRQAPQPPKLTQSKDALEDIEIENRRETAMMTKPCATTTELRHDSTTTLPTTTPAQTSTTPQNQLPPLLVTDSWHLANKGLVVTEMPTPPSQESSSDSVFTDPGELNTIPSMTITKTMKSPPVSSPEANIEEKSPFRISRHKKIHLSVLSPRIKLKEKTEASSPTLEVPNLALQRRHSINETSVREGTVLRRVASLTLNRSAVKKKSASKNIIPQKIDRHKQFEEQKLSIRLTSTLPTRSAKRDAPFKQIDQTCVLADEISLARTIPPQTCESSMHENVHRYEEEVKKLKVEIELLRETSTKQQINTRGQSTQTSPRSLSPVDKDASEKDDSRRSPSIKTNVTNFEEVETAITPPFTNKTAIDKHRSYLSDSKQTSKFEEFMELPKPPSPLESFSASRSLMSISTTSEQSFIPPPPPPPPSSPLVLAFEFIRPIERKVPPSSSSELTDVPRIPPPPPPPSMSTQHISSTFPAPPPLSSISILNMIDMIPPPPPPPPPSMQSIMRAVTSSCFLKGTMNEVPPPPPPPLPSSFPSMSVQSVMSDIPTPPPPPPLPAIGSIAGEICTTMKSITMSTIPPPPPPPTPMLNACGIPPPPPPPPPLPPLVPSCSLVTRITDTMPPPPPPPPPPPLLPGTMQNSMSDSSSSIPLSDVSVKNGIPPPPPLIQGSGAGPPPPPMAPPPPPGAIGPCPLPAPPIGGWNPPSRAVMRKEALNPDVPMKPLYWTRIIVPITATSQISAENEESSSKSKAPLWLELTEEENLNMKEFADLFSRQVREKTFVKKTDVMAKGSIKIQPAKILDSKRSKMVGILEKSLHIDFSEIENAAYNLDTNVISLEALQQIYEIKPTEEEIMQIAAHESSYPDIPLDQPELFLKRLSGIKHFSERIACLMLQSEFQDAISSLSYKLNNVGTTCDFLINSESLRKILAIILTLGNYMNGGNMMRGQADGFGLEILGKLKDVKSNTPGVTLLHYVVNAKLSQEKEHNFDELLPLPVPEPADVEAASTIKFDDIAKELDRLEKELNTCARKCNMVVEADPTTSKVFKQKVDSFVMRATTELANGKQELQEARNKFKAVMRFYQFIPKGATIDTAEPHDFFNLWLGFCRDFKDIWKKEQLRIRKERLEEVRRKLENKSDVVRVKLNPHGLKARLQKLTTKKQTHR